MNILLGVGLLSVPYALQQGGCAGLGVLSLLGAMTNYTGKVRSVITLVPIRPRSAW